MSSNINTEPPLLTVISGDPHKVYIDYGDELNGTIRVVPPFTPTEEYLGHLTSEGYGLRHLVTTVGATILSLERIRNVDDELHSVEFDHGDVERIITGLVEDLDAISEGSGGWTPPVASN